MFTTNATDAAIPGHILTLFIQCPLLAMQHLLCSAFNRMSFLVTCLVISNVGAYGYVIGNKLSKTAGNGQSNIAYSQDNKGSYQFAYEVTDKGTGCDPGFQSASG